MRSWIGLAVVVAIGGGTGAEEKVIPSAEAGGHVGETLTVRMTVRHVKDSPHEDCVFLDSEADYKDPKNLAVVIAHEHVGAFKKAGVADPSTHYDGKTIRVTGKLIREKDQTRIRVSEPKQIEVVADKKAA